MAAITDVAAYILEKAGPMTAMKLQKLCYYSHAWHLVWEDEPMFDCAIQAWANGPVAPDLYREHRGQFRLSPGFFKDADPTSLQPHVRESIDVVLGSYADKSAQQLSELTHKERPWLDARKGLEPGERGNEQISDAAMVEYYSSLG